MYIFKMNSRRSVWAGERWWAGRVGRWREGKASRSVFYIRFYRITAPRRRATTSRNSVPKTNVIYERRNYMAAVSSLIPTGCYKTTRLVIVSEITSYPSGVCAVQPRTVSRILLRCQFSLIYARSGNET